MKSFLLFKTLYKYSRLIDANNASRWLILCYLIVTTRWRSQQQLVRNSGLAWLPLTSLLQQIRHAFELVTGIRGSRCVLWS